MPRGESLEERFWSKVKKIRSGKLWREALRWQ
jgi:hypothetical protein